MKDMEVFNDNSTVEKQQLIDRMKKAMLAHDDAKKNKVKSEQQKLSHKEIIGILYKIDSIIENKHDIKRAEELVNLVMKSLKLPKVRLSIKEDLILSCDSEDLVERNAIKYLNDNLFNFNSSSEILQNNLVPMDVLGFFLLDEESLHREFECMFYERIYLDYAQSLVNDKRGKASIRRKFKTIFDSTTIDPNQVKTLYRSLNANTRQKIMSNTKLVKLMLSSFEMDWVDRDKFEYLKTVYEIIK